MNYLEVGCLISKYTENFLLSVTDFKYDYMMAREHIFVWFQFQFIEVCSMLQDMVYIDECSTGAWEKCELYCCWVECSVDVC